jgi:hypothetical protein
MHGIKASTEQSTQPLTTSGEPLVTRAGGIKMKRIGWLFLVVLCSAVLLNAEDKGDRVTGWVCDSRCVVHTGDMATCNPDCTERSGEAVFIHDNGKVTRISNPDTCTEYMNHRVTARGSWENQHNQDRRESEQEVIRLQELQNDSGAE